VRKNEICNEEQFVYRHRYIFGLWALYFALSGMYILLATISTILM
jgi:hypothetical protein